jgi:arsenate reductase
MAHGYLAHFAPEGTEVFSAGVQTHGVNPGAIEIMKADGIDNSNHTSNNILEYEGQDFDYVITVCDNAKETCPYFPSKAVKFHNDFMDPSKVEGSAEEIITAFTQARDQIKAYCKEFVSAYL